MSEKLIYYALYGSSHLRRRGCHTRKQILSGQETRQLKRARANVITRRPGGQFSALLNQSSSCANCHSCRNGALLSGQTSLGQIFYALHLFLFF